MKILTKSLTVMVKFRLRDTLHPLRILEHVAQRDGLAESIEAGEP